MKCNLHEDDHHEGDGIIEVCFSVEVTWMDQARRLALDVGEAVYEPNVGTHIGALYDDWWRYIYPYMGRYT